MAADDDGGAGAGVGPHYRRESDVSNGFHPTHHDMGGVPAAYTTPTSSSTTPRSQPQPQPRKRKDAESDGEEKKPKKTRQTRESAPARELLTLQNLVMVRRSLVEVGGER